MYEALRPFTTRPPIMVRRGHVLYFPKEVAKVVPMRAILIIVDPHHCPGQLL